MTTKTVVRRPKTVSFSEAETAEVFGIPYWGGGYFGIAADGQMQIYPEGKADLGLPSVGLNRIVKDLVDEGNPLPVILRFPQILENRLSELNTVFRNAIDKFEYSSHYQGVYPIKVNQRRVVVETIAEFGARFKTGLEAGSKAELALCLAQDMHPEGLLCCNGFKDDDFIRLALWGRQMGKNVVITLEKYGELSRVLRISRELGIKPALGIRFKLHARGSGKWEDSGGDAAKFGLGASELINVVETLRDEAMLDHLQLLHCHVGSQITDIRKIKIAVREISRTYADLRRMGANIRFLNVGGGLAVDYDGSRTTFYVSANYGLQEYADDVVYTVKEVCDEQEVPHPVLVSESGRALTAHHSVLVIPVIDAIGSTRERLNLPDPGEEAHSLISEMQDLLKNVTVKNYTETYYDALSYKDTMHNLFDLGYLSLLERAHVENLFDSVIKKVAQVIKGLDYVPEEFEALPKLLADKYVCNFSLFQSLPDHWAIQALFPVVPLTRLTERPDRQATLVDISCDSDGKINKFVDLRNVKPTLPLHDISDGRPYYIGVFLTGAYQDVLANTHNLFGRVNEAHIRVSGPEQYRVESFEEGQKTSQVIENVGYHAHQLIQWIDQDIAEARQSGLLDDDQARQLREKFEAELVGYTYLED